MRGTLDAVRGRCRFPERGPVTCAVSGGADSLALLALACDAGLAPTAVHVDHGLRPGSADEAAVVEAAATRWGASFRAVRVHVEPGADLEARARRARHDAVGPGALFGHTADDQAETVLLALLRGTGTDGLAAMGHAQHPILALRRHETRAVCAELGVRPVNDPSNADPRPGPWPGGRCGPGSVRSCPVGTRPTRPRSSASWPSPPATPWAPRWPAGCRFAAPTSASGSSRPRRPRIATAVGASTRFSANG